MTNWVFFREMAIEISERSEQNYVDQVQVIQRIQHCNQIIIKCTCCDGESDGIELGVSLGLLDGMELGLPEGDSNGVSEG